MKRPDRVPSRRRANAVVEIGVLLALVALVVLAIVVGRSADDAVDVAPEIAPAPELDEPTGIEVADSTPSPMIPVSMTMPPSSVPPIADRAGTRADVDALASGRAGSGDVSNERQDPPPLPADTKIRKGPFAAIDVGLGFTCGLLVSDHVECWGINETGRARPPDSEFSAIHAGTSLACGLRRDGAVECWGSRAGSEPVIIEGHYTAVRAGRVFACALRADRAIVCFRYDDQPQLRPAAQVEVACTLRADGAGICVEVEEDLESIPASPDEFVSLAAGWLTFCAIKVDGSAACWDEHVPHGLLHHLEPPSGPFKQIYVSAVGNAVCAIRVDHSAVCWGHLWAGVNGELPGRYSQLALGTFDLCGLKVSGEIDCWGWSFDESPPPNGEFLDLSAGESHVCGVRANGDLECWGRVGTTGTRAPPGTYTAVETREFRNCAIRSDQAVVCWNTPP